MPIATRGFYISLLAVACILGLGVLFFRGSEAASQITVVVALAVGVALFSVIDHRDRGRDRRPPIVRIGDHEFDDVAFDADADVLYMHKGRPVPARKTIPTFEGHAIRLNGAGEIIGITVVNAKWLAERDGQITVTIPATTSAAQRLEASADDLAAALA